MNDILILIQIVLGVAAMTAPFIVLVRLIAGLDADSLPTLVTPATARLTWPSGVQEDDGLRWNVRVPRSAGT